MYCSMSNHNMIYFQGQVSFFLNLITTHLVKELKHELRLRCYPVWMPESLLFLVFQYYDIKRFWKIRFELPLHPAIGCFKPDRIKSLGKLISCSKMHIWNDFFPFISTNCKGLCILKFGVLMEVLKSKVNILWPTKLFEVCCISNWRLSSYEIQNMLNTLRRFSGKYFLNTISCL